MASDVSAGMPSMVMVGRGPPAPLPQRLHVRSGSLALKRSIASASWVAIFSQESATSWSRASQRSQNQASRSSSSGRRFRSITSPQVSAGRTGQCGVPAGQSSTSPSRIRAAWRLPSLKPIVEFAAKNRMPAMFGDRAYVDAGGLMSYWTSWNDLARRAASYVTKILKGAKPGDLPVEEPAKFELVVNLKAAKAFGLTMPQSILVRADELIQ